MARRYALVIRFLLLLGAALTLVGVLAVAVAIADPRAVKAQLPEVQIDAAAVGGALAALGVGAVALGTAHLVVGIGLRVRARWSTTAAVVLCATLAVLSVAAGVAAAVSAGRSAWFSAAGIGLAVLTVAYAGCAGVVIDRMRTERAASG